MMLKDLKLENIMYFQNQSDELRQLSFGDALDQLAKSVLKKTEYSLEELEEKLIRDLRSFTEDLIDGKPVSSVKESHQTILEFYRWIFSIHNQDLIPEQGLKYPKNIVYDIISNLRTDLALAPEYQLMHIFMEGANARKIFDGNTPHLDWISTAIMLDSIDAVKTLFGKLPKGCEDFYKELEDIRKFSEVQKKLETSVTRIKANSVFEKLASSEILSLEHQKNEQFATNRYLIQKAIENGVKKELGNKDELLSMLKAIKDYFEPVLESYEKVIQDNNSSEINVNLVIWDASEWVSRVYTAQQIAISMLKEKYNVDVAPDDLLFQNGLGKVIIDRSISGEFPGAIERNNLLSKVELVELFTKANIDRVVKQAVSVGKNSMFAPNPGQEDFVVTQTASLS